LPEEQAEEQTEEQTEEQSEQSVEESKTNTESTIENEARRQGWVPKEEFKGDLDNWRPAQEWVARGPLMDKISDRNKEIKQLRKSVETLTKLAVNQTKLLNEPKIENLRQKKIEAIQEGDVENAERYEAAYNKAQAEAAQITAETAPQNSTPDLAPEVYEFAARNKSWFNQDTPQNIQMARFAEGIEATLTHTRPELSVSDRLNETEKLVKQQFPHRFENPNRNKQPVVEGRTQAVRRPQEITYNDLPFEVKQIVNGMISADRTGANAGRNRIHSWF